MLSGLLVVVGILVLVGGYRWWQTRPLDPASVLRRAPFPQLMQLRRVTIISVAVVLLLVCLGVVYVVRRTITARGSKKTHTVTLAPAPQTQPSSAAFLQRFPKDYAPVVEAAPLPDTPPPPPKGVPVPWHPANGATPALGARPVAALTQPGLTQAQVEDLVAKALAKQKAEHDQALAAALAQQARTQQAAVVHTPPTPTPQQAQAPVKKKGWDEPEDTETTKTGTTTTPPVVSKLFPPATWERPADPLRVLYASQLIHGLLEQAVVTGEASTVRFRVTQTIYDKFGQHIPLMPMDSLVLGEAEGTVKRGQTRVRIKVQKVELPDGTDLSLDGKVGDAGGAAGIRGKVDNKYGQVILATLLSTALSVGARVAGGNSDSYQPTIQQEFGRDASQGFNQAGQQLVREALNVQPEIFLEAQTPITIQLEKNISLQTRPVIVSK